VYCLLDLASEQERMWTQADTGRFLTVCNALIFEKKSGLVNENEKKLKSNFERVSVALSPSPPLIVLEDT